ncbi:hypothetical protein CJJ09_004994 [Candidozyma auris]|nr:hypothetical protein CJJ09_004994 [[Candida] auris]
MSAGNFKRRGGVETATVKTAAPPVKPTRATSAKRPTSTRKTLPQAQDVQKKTQKLPLGCGTCKKRRIKCDENLPQCFNCVKGKLHCAYLNLDAPARNALRLAQYNQNLRQDNVKDKKDENGSNGNTNNNTSNNNNNNNNKTQKNPSPIFSWATSRITQWPPLSEHRQSNTSKHTCPTRS